MFLKASLHGLKRKAGGLGGGLINGLRYLLGLRRQGWSGRTATEAAAARDEEVPKGKASVGARGCDAGCNS